LVLFSLVAVLSGEQPAEGSDRAEPRPERVLFSPDEDGRPGRCHIVFTPDGKFLLTDGIDGGPTAVSTADWSARALVAADADDRRLRLLTASFPRTAIVQDCDNKRLLAVDPSRPNQPPVDLGSCGGRLHRWAAARQTRTLAIMERVDGLDGRNLRLSLINPATGARRVLQEAASVRPPQRGLHFFDFMDSDRYLVWVTGDAVGVWDLSKPAKVAEADLVGHPCRMDDSHRRALGLSASDTSPAFWICARQGGLFEGRLEEGRIELESVPARAKIAKRREKRPTFRGPHGSLGAHGSSVPSLRYHQAFPWHGDRWLVAKTHYYAVFGPNDFSVKVIDIAGGASLVSLPVRGLHMPPWNSVTVSDAAGLMAIQASDGTVRVWRRKEIERYVTRQTSPSSTSITRIFAAVKAGIVKTFVEEAVAAADEPPALPPSRDWQR
jgi:hypothetical protein